MALACDGGVVTVVAVTEVELVLEGEMEVVAEMALEIQTVLEDALLTFVTPGIDTVFHFFPVVKFVVGVDGEFFGCLAFEDEETHEIEVIANGETTVEGELETVADRGACAVIVTAEGVVVGCTASEGNGGKHEVVGEGCPFLPSPERWRVGTFEKESDPETGCFGDEGEVAWVFVVFFAVVVDVFDILIEAEVEFPLMGKLVLAGADASTDVEFADSGLVGSEVDEGVKFEVVVGTRTFPFVEMVEVVAVGEAEIEVGDGFVIAYACLWVDRGTVIDVASARSDLEGVGHGFFLLASIEAVDTEHFARHDAVEASNGVEEGADDFTDNTLGTPFGVVEEDVGHAVGHFTDGCSSDTCGEEVIDGGAVGLAEEFPSEGTCQGVEE